MAKPGAYHYFIALTVLSVLAVLVVDVHGGDGCPSFSCGHLRDVRYPFRRLGDPPGCGVEAYELVCSSSKATIYINTGTYSVTGINYTDLSFLVMDANLDMNSSCPLPCGNKFLTQATGRKVTKLIHVAFGIWLLTPIIGHASLIVHEQLLITTCTSLLHASVQAIHMCMYGGLLTIVRFEIFNLLVATWP